MCMGIEKKTYYINGGKALSGAISAGGSKNVSFPILASALLCRNEVVIGNVPKIRDIDILVQILEKLGVDVQSRECEKSVCFTVPQTVSSVVPYDLGSKIRGGLYLLGALLAREGKAVIPFPGGCDIGERGFLLHIDALRRMGAEIDLIDGNIVAECRQLHGVQIALPFPSKGVTINLILAATAAVGDTVIENANTSPDLLHVCEFLSDIGVDIEGMGTSRVVVHDCRRQIREQHNIFRIPPDKIEVATILVAGLMTKGAVTVKGIFKRDIEDFLAQIEKMNVSYTLKEGNISVKWNKDIVGASVITGFPPKIDPDYEPILASLLCVLKEKVKIYDSINPERHSRYLPELIRLGALINEEDNATAEITGVEKLVGCDELYGKDLRGTVGLLLAALSIPRKTVLHGAEIVERGYECLHEKLKYLGADILCLPTEEIPSDKKNLI